VFKEIKIGNDREPSDERKMPKLPQEAHLTPDAKRRKSRSSVMGKMRIKMISLEYFTCFKCMSFWAKRQGKL